MPGDDELQHPILTEEDDRQQRGENPPGAFGHTGAPSSGDLDLGWIPSNDVKDEAEKLIKDTGRGHRPRREDVYPYLLIRAYSPGDRGARPVFPQAHFSQAHFWDSPDILLIDAEYTGPFTLTQLIANPTTRRRYRVFVRVWNLGLLPAIGVHVRASYVNPRFFGGSTNPAHQPVLIGGAMVNLDDRTRPGAMQVVEIDQTWDIPNRLVGRGCLVASASCPLDQWGSNLDANGDRHVGQRNLEIFFGLQEHGEGLPS